VWVRARYYLLVRTAHAILNAGRKALEDGDHRTAVAELLPLARKGNASAQYYIGLMCHQGKGLPEDNSAAAGWARKAAAQGNAEAEALLGILYAQGQGVRRDDVEAARWFQKAALQGNWMGQMKMGICHMCGLGLPLDYLKAYMWFDLATSRSTGHDQMLNRNLRDIFAAMHLTPAQIEEARHLARRWKSQEPPLPKAVQVA
jgi:uncharacterized protein